MESTGLGEPQPASATVKPRSAMGMSPVDPGVEALVLTLRAQLGGFGYQWLCACAVYPRLRFSLSVWLGRVVAQGLDRPPPSEEEDLALFGLPWFRQAWMPEDLRLRLVEDLDVRLREPVREAIERILYTVIAAAPHDDGSSAIVVREPPRGWSPALRAYIDRMSGRSRLGDALFLRYMHGRDLHAESLASERRMTSLLGRPLVSTFEALGKGLYWAGFVLAVAGAAFFSLVHLLALLGFDPQLPQPDPPTFEYNYIEDGAMVEPLDENEYLDANLVTVENLSKLDDKNPGVPFDRDLANAAD